MRIWLISIFAWSVVCILFALCVHSAVADTACDIGTINKIETHLNNVRNFRADFTQVDHDATLQSGRIYLARPGKLRWEYVKPKHILILVNGRKATYYDYELQEKSKLRVKSTIINFLVNDKISLHNLNLQHCSISDKEYELVVMPQHREDLNIALTVILQKSPIMFKKFIIRNLDDKTSSMVDLIDVESDCALDNDIFDFEAILKKERR